MRVGALGGFDELIDDMLWRGPIRVAHRHIDNVFTATACCHFQFGRDIKNVWGKTLDTGKFVVHFG